MKNYLISVIVPVYNSSSFLKDSISSLQNQTYQNLEILLIDDGSTDNSLDICKDISFRDKRVKVFYKSNGGVASARNFGLSKASGDFIGFMDNDDFIEPDMYEILLSTLLKTGASIAQVLVENVGTDFRLNEQVKSCSFEINSISSHDFKKTLLLQNGNLCCWSKLFRKEVFEKYQFVDGRWNEDVLLLYKIFSDKNYSSILSINKIGYHYVQRKGSYSKSGFNQGYIDNLINARFFIDLEEKHDLIECGYRYYFHMFISYYLCCTKEYLKEKRDEYLDFLSWVEIKKDFWKSNDYLTKKEKRFLNLIYRFPFLATVIARLYKLKKKVKKK